MKYSVHDYAKALDEAIADPKAKHDAIIKNFLALVRRNNDEGRLKKILAEAARLSRKWPGAQGNMREVIVESARPLRKAQEKMLQQFIKPGDIVRYKVNPELVAGVKIVVNDEMQFDGTMKAKLDKLFT